MRRLQNMALWLGHNANWICIRDGPLSITWQLTSRMMTYTNPWNMLNFPFIHLTIKNGAALWMSLVTLWFSDTIELQTSWPPLVNILPYHLISTKLYCLNQCWAIVRWTLSLTAICVLLWQRPWEFFLTILHLSRTKTRVILGSITSTNSAQFYKI